MAQYLRERIAVFINPKVWLRTRRWGGPVCVEPSGTRLRDTNSPGAKFRRVPRGVATRTLRPALFRARKYFSPKLCPNLRFSHTTRMDYSLLLVVGLIRRDRD